MIFHTFCFDLIEFAIFSVDDKETSNSFLLQVTLHAMKQFSPKTDCGSSPLKNTSMTLTASGTFWGQPSLSHTLPSLPILSTPCRWAFNHLSFEWQREFISKWTYFIPQIVLPPHLERIREKLAENSHELWAVTRIEQGWTYGPVSLSFKHVCTILVLLPFYVPSITVSTI